MTAARQAPGASGERTATREDLVEEVRHAYGTPTLDLVHQLSVSLGRRVGFALASPGALLLAALVGVGVRLAVALIATALVGQWAEVPWGRWAVILAFYGLFDAQQIAFLAPSVASWSQRVVEDWTALVPTIEREADLQDLARYTRHWNRWAPAAGTGVAVAASMLLVSALVAPAALRELPAGSIVLLVFLLYDFGVYPIHSGNLLNWAFMSREARYDHHLFWPSPSDSPEVHQALRKTTNQGSAAGFWITVFLVLAVVLVSWGSPLVAPLAVGFVVIGYLTTIGTALSGRAGVRRIIDRSRRRRLAVLRERIDAFEPRFADLSHQEAEELRDLLLLHDKIRDAPATPTTTRTVVRTAAGLIIPTVMFVVTVFGEVSAERMLDRFLP